MTLHHGDCLDVLRAMADCSIDAVVTDPPYGLAFMGKRWDYDVPSVAIWAECLRVLKPGGHLLAFAGTRTQHRMAVRIEDAGFEIRDMIAWVYGSGFPKSLDVSETMAKRLAGERLAGAVINPDVYLVTGFLRAARDRAGWTNKQIDGLFGTNGMAGHWTTMASQPAVPSVRQWQELKQALGFGDELDELAAQLAATERPEGWGEGEGKEGPFLGSLHGRNGLGKSQSWGTALKPALEPVTVARKPPAGTMAGNVMDYGTGAMNIDGCRIDGEKWPANLIHDGSDEVTAGLADAARFFYTAKASRSDRDPDNRHPTVKPTDLMRYLCRLVTPPGGIVLDPFMGSGSTGKAAMLEGFEFIGIERDADSFATAQQRIGRAAAAGHQPSLFETAP